MRCERLYLVTRADFGPGPQAVQTCHAGRFVGGVWVNDNELSAWLTPAPVAPAASAVHPEAACAANASTS